MLDQFLRNLIQGEFSVGNKKCAFLDILLKIAEFAKSLKISALIQPLAVL